MSHSHACTDLEMLRCHAGICAERRQVMHTSLVNTHLPCPPLLLLLFFFLFLYLFLLFLLHPTCRTAREFQRHPLSVLTSRVGSTKRFECLHDYIRVARSISIWEVNRDNDGSLSIYMAFEN